MSWTAVKENWKSVGERLVDALFNIHPNVEDKWGHAVSDRFNI